MSSCHCNHAIRGRTTVGQMEKGSKCGCFRESGAQQCHFLAILLDMAGRVDLFCLTVRFPIVGDLSVQHSNIFAPQEEGEVREDYVRFEKGRAELQDHDSNQKRLSECEQMLLASGRKEQQSAAGDPHGICQGLKIHSDGTMSQKIRCIDDATIVGINEGTIIPERVLLPSCELVGTVAGEIVRTTESVPQTNLLLGAEDIRSAYRRFGNGSVDHSSLVFAMQIPSAWSGELYSVPRWSAPPARGPFAEFPPQLVRLRNAGRGW